MNKVPLLPFAPSDDRAMPVEIKRFETLPASAVAPIPHRHAFYVMFWVTAGSGVHYLDFVGDEIRPNSLHLVGPGQVHYWDTVNKLEGLVILFDSTFFLEKTEQQLLDQFSFFRSINCVSALYPSATDIAYLKTIIDRLEQEYLQSRFARPPAMMAWLRLLLIEAQRLAVISDSSQGVITADKQLAYRYIQLVEQNAIAQHKVNWYANELAITVAHLSKSVKNAMGITAGALLRDRIVLEARRLLVHTEETAAAIALQLNFEDASYFGRFFKRETGQTPRQFRMDKPRKYQKQPTK